MGLGDAKEKEYLLCDDMLISLTSSKESLGEYHLEVPKGWVMYAVRKLGGWVRAAFAGIVTLEGVYIFLYEITSRKFIYNIEASLKTYKVSKLLVVKLIFLSK